MRERDENGRFIKGVSGNPAGRPATPEDVKTALKSATLPSVMLLINLMRDESTPAAIRVKCAEIVLDRTLGKPVQPLEASFSQPIIDMSDITVDELRRLATLDQPKEPDDSTGGPE